VKKEVEILVVGGGPAGLLTAAYLAERHQVALIERGVLGETTKYWATSLRRLEKHGLEDCVLYRPTSLVVGTFLGGYLETSGDFVIVDDQRLLRRLVERCRSQGVLLTEQCSLLNMSWSDTRLHVQTTSDSYITRLIIDASGGQSPIAATFRLHKLYGFFSVYGALLRNIRLNTKNLILGYVEHLGDPPPIIEVFPCGDDAAYCCVFLYSKQLVPPDKLETVFRTHCRHNSFFGISDKTEIVAPKMGAIPIGCIRKRHLAGVVPMGEAGLAQPPLLGSAFNEVLEYCREACSHVSRVLANTSGLPPKPGYRYPLLKRMQDRLQLRLARALLDGNIAAFDRLVRIMGKLPSEVIYNFCSNELSWREMFKVVATLPYDSLALSGMLLYGGHYDKVLRRPESKTDTA
jgi:hypothetical protein